MICGLGTADAGLGIGIAWVAGIPLVEDKEDLKKKPFGLIPKFISCFLRETPLIANEILKVSIGSISNIRFMFSEGDSFN